MRGVWCAGGREALRYARREESAEAVQVPGGDNNDPEAWQMVGDGRGEGE